MENEANRAKQEADKITDSLKEKLTGLSQEEFHRFWAEIKAESTTGPLAIDLIKTFKLPKRRRSANGHGFIEFHPS